MCSWIVRFPCRGDFRGTARCGKAARRTIWGINLIAITGRERQSHSLTRLVAGKSRWSSYKHEARASV